MLKRLIDYVESAGARRSIKLTLQDMALCQLWCSAPGGAANDLAGHVQSWTREPDPQDLNTPARRHQFLLRELIEVAQHHHYDTLTGDEAAVLCAAYELANKVRDRAPFARVDALLREHVRALALRRDARGLSPGLASLDRRIQYVSEAEILRAPAAQIRLLAGIELPCRGPIFKASGHLRILGDVPEDCTVVVENNGYCCVDGYVLGRVLSKRQCEIRYNISGVAVVLHGSIRARSIINNAIAIAKMGSVICTNAQGPRLVFAGKSIEVTQSTLMGRFITRDMAVGGEVRGSHLEIAGQAAAPQFRNLGMSTATVVLRRELSCEDFGEVTGAEHNQMFSRSNHLRRRARNFSHLASAARGEANHTAQSVLMVVFGGGEVQKRLEGFLRAQRRYQFVGGVVDNLRGILDCALDGLHFSIDDADDLPDAVPDSDAAAEGDLEDLKPARADAAKLKHTLRSHAHDRRQATLVLEEVREKLGAMLALQAQLAELMQKEERAIQNLEKYEQILAGSGREATKLDVLNKILPALQSQPAESTMGKRLRSTFVLRALRTIERAVRHAGDFEQKAGESLADFHAVSERLGRDFQIRVLENPEDEQVSARVTGRFEGGVRIYVNGYAENLADLPAGSVLTAPNDDSVHTYIRSNGGARFYSAE